MEVFGRSGSLVGIRTSPAGGVAGRPALVFLNAGIVYRVGPNRIYVRIARALAEEGVESFRFDLSGIGDSGPPDGSGGESVQEATDRDIDDALDHLQAAGHDRFILAGLCSGADNALRTMARDRRVVGAVLLDPRSFRTAGYYLRFLADRIFDPASWAKLLRGRWSFVRGTIDKLLAGHRGNGGRRTGLAAGPATEREVIREQLRHLIERNAQFLYVFTAGLAERYNYRDQLFHTFPGLAMRNRVTLHYYAGSDHVFSRLADQERLVRDVLSWIRTTRFPGDATSGEPPPQ